MESKDENLGLVLEGVSECHWRWR